MVYIGIGMSRWIDNWWAGELSPPSCRGIRVWVETRNIMQPTLTTACATGMYLLPSSILFCIAFVYCMCFFIYSMLFCFRFMWTPKVKLAGYSVFCLRLFLSLKNSNIMNHTVQIKKIKNNWILNHSFSAVNLQKNKLVQWGWWKICK